MRVFQKRTVVIWCALTLLFVVGNGFALEKLSTETLLPKDLVIEEDFQQGNGFSVGLVQVVEGRVVIMHADMLRGYLAKKDLPLFQGDIIVTRKDGRARLAMNDGSILSLAPDTRMTINQSVYHKKKKRRFSFFKLFGKARFWVKKLVDLRQSDVKIKTQTAVVGVRGSDFIIEATLEATEVTALDLEGSQLEIASLADPKAKPTILNSNQKSVIKKDGLPTEPVDVPPDEREQVVKDFIPMPEPGEPIEPLEPAEAGKPGEPVKPVFFSYVELINPEEIISPEELEKQKELYKDVSFSQFIKEVETEESMDYIREQKQEIEEINRESGATTGDYTGTW